MKGNGNGHMFTRVHNRITTASSSRLLDGGLGRVERVELTKLRIVRIVRQRKVASRGATCRIRTTLVSTCPKLAGVVGNTNDGRFNTTRIGRLVTACRPRAVAFRRGTLVVSIGEDTGSSRLCSTIQFD